MIRTSSTSLGSLFCFVVLTYRVNQTKETNNEYI
jgi:hypothetical protein